MPFDKLLRAGKMLPEADLRAVFDGAGVKLDAPLALSCGSGVTASAVALALAVLGRWAATTHSAMLRTSCRHLLCASSSHSPLLVFGRPLWWPLQLINFVAILV